MKIIFPVDYQGLGPVCVVINGLNDSAQCSLSENTATISNFGQIDSGIFNFEISAINPS